MKQKHLYRDPKEGEQETPATETATSDSQESAGEGGEGEE